MIVTRSWLEEFLDLSDISNDALLEKLNNIGLEVDGAKSYNIPSKVVVGEVVECSKHPNADKLNVCKVNIGSEVVQIVCGAKNVVNAKYVAVATIGAVLPGDFKIKKAKLRGVESYGMICSSTELGLPPLEDGIMILDDSIGELVVGKELNEYKRVADLVIEIGLTPNRGDCTSVRGVARDLAAAFKKDLEREPFKVENLSIIGIARELQVDCKCDFDGVLEYTLLNIEDFEAKFLHRLRCAFCELDVKDDIDTALSYAVHDSGVILRAYDYNKLPKVENRVEIEVVKTREYQIDVVCDGKVLSTVGVNANEEFKATNLSNKIILEASYIDPEFIIEGVSQYKLKTDKFYYNTSRGSEPNIDLGLNSAYEVLCKDQNCSLTQSTIKVGKRIESKRISVNIEDIVNIIGEELPKGEIASILQSLGFTIHRADNEAFAIDIPLHRHDIANTHDIAEEVVRIHGIDNIVPKPLIVEEKNRINKVYLNYLAKKDISQRAVAAGFFEAITYAFANRESLIKYGFEVVDENLDIINPIVKELNTLRTTILVNLLEAAKRNVSYGKKSIALFEVGPVFNSKREESIKMAFIFSGEDKRASVANSAKAKIITFSEFVDKINRVIGDFKLINSTPKTKLEHPYICAEIIKDGKVAGKLFKLHPKVAKDYDLNDTFMCELDFEAVIDKHKNATELSNFQAVNKDLSVLVDKELKFYEVAKELGKLKDENEILKDFYPLDIYSDESLGDKNSLTIRFTLQSNKATLSDEEIDGVMSLILERLKERFGAELR